MSRQFSTDKIRPATLKALSLEVEPISESTDGAKGFASGIAESEHERGLIKLSQPLALTNFIIRWPKITLSLSYLILIAIAVFVLMTGANTPNKISQRDYLVWDDPKTWRFDKESLIEERLVTGSSDQAVPLQT